MPAPKAKGFKHVLLILLIVSAVLAGKWIFQVDPVLCNGCGACIHWCKEGALYMSGGDAVIDPELCNGCGICAGYCPRDAIYRVYYEGIEESESSLSPMYGPNPTPGPVYIEGALPGTEIYILDMSGRLTTSVGTDSDGLAHVDLTGYASGIYSIIHGEQILGEITLVQ